MIREFTHIDLRDRNSFGVEQRAARLVEFETADDLRELFRGGIPEQWYVLSGGNNILFTRDYDGVLITPVGRRITPLLDDGEAVLVRAEAGVEWDDLVEWAVERGLWGIENLSLIPGKAGAAPVQNIGAYGCEAKDAIERVEMFCVETGTMLTLDEMLGRFSLEEILNKNLDEAASEGMHVMTIHSELEGMAYAEYFEKFLKSAKERGVEFVSLNDYADELLKGKNRLPVKEVKMLPFEGRSALLAQSI